MLRKQPETFCCTLTMRKSLSARLLSKSTRRSSRKARTPAGVCATDQADYGQHFVCSAHLDLAGQQQEDASDPLHRAVRGSRKPTRFLLALWTRTFRLAHKPIPRRGQVAIVTIFRQLVSHGLQLLAQTAYLLGMPLYHRGLRQQP